MKTLWDPRRQQELLTRIRSLRPDAPARWGRFTCPQMVVHATDALALYCGDLQCEVKRTPLLYPPLKQAIVYLMPMPKNVPTARVLLARAPGRWDEEIARLEQAIATFASHHARTEWPLHPLFGRLSARAYGVLAYRHTDHHLRQFGV
ncbi:MAG TPA: DUF1569 domain-containing protein [Vicinamibacterales bacterium]